jgi:hypothetical protein
VTTAPGPFIVLQAKSGDSPISITLHYAAIRELRGCVKPGLGASGLLFGRRTEDSAEIEHCSATAAGVTPPIGLFRTQAAGWPVVTEEDCRRVQQLLTVTPSDALFLVVRTLAQRPWAATLFAINPKQPTTAAAPILEFPFDEYVLQNGWLLDLAPPPTLLPRMTEEPEPPRRSRSWLALAAAVALIGGGGAAAYQFHWLPWRAEGQLNDAPDAVSPSLPLTAIALRVERSNDDFEVRWNRSSEAVQTATAGTLIIRNGPVTRIVPLSAGQLREGHVQYRPLTGVDADFRLELMAGD